MFDITNQFDSRFDKNSVWNCRYCTNLNNGCDKCSINKFNENGITTLCRSFQYYLFHKIKCECLGQGCKYCKFQGFIIERIHNYKNHEEYYENDPEYKNFNEKYTIIDEEDWNHFKCLGTFFIPPSEKERLKKNILIHDNFFRQLKMVAMKIFSNPETIQKLMKNIK